MSLEMLNNEDERTKLIDSKGVSVLGMSGISTSIVFSLGLVPR